MMMIIDINHKAGTTTELWIRS